MSIRGPVWHPFTQHATASAPVLTARGEGAFLVTAEGRRIFDAISSWWVITHGHCHPRIVAAIQAQAEKLDQVIFAGFTHEPAERLARLLLGVAPRGLSHVFFSDSGSTAVEVGMKMALGYFRNRGEARTRVVALEHAYHGDTIGTMSAGARGIFNQPYAPLLFDVLRIPYPSASGSASASPSPSASASASAAPLTATSSEAQQKTVDALEAACRRGDVAALVVEPLLLGAGGMLVYSPRVLRALKDVCERHGVLFVADEVLTGWGRTGTLFACEQANVEPDILCMAKGLTGGTLPLAATLCRPEIFDAHYSPDRSRAFFHSSSYTANPIACAAAVANLEVWATEPVRERIAKLVSMQSERLEPFRDDPRFESVRQIGTVAALDIKARDPGYLADMGPFLYAFFMSRDVLLRPLGNTVYLMPPYGSTGEDLDRAYEAIREAVDAIAAVRGDAAWDPR
ncbi:MAG: adenosylmethionine--8-amino-7-oxononanoate transaminase [Deltaproteobacteria bacterium]|nr:adenosylmethionine--8-amino-7-oxononanoate transaminase [Deltaproteobacteria bacterium]